MIRRNLVPDVIGGLLIAQLLTACRAGVVTSEASAPLDESNPGVTVFGTETIILSAAHIDQDYKIFVGLPWSYPNLEKNYPVLYMLDANIWFGSVLEYTRLDLSVYGRSEVIVVGIGYPTEDEDILLTRRYNDFVQEPSDFLQFIREELMPEINANYRVKPDENALIGHSFGGSFALYTLFEKPETFDRYIIGSPTITEKIVSQEVEYAANHVDLPAKVFIGAGDMEGPLMANSLLKMALQIEERSYENLEFKTTVFEFEDHISVFLPILTYGFRTLFG